MIKFDIRFHLNAHQNIYHWQNYYTETSFNMDFKNFFFFFQKSQMSTVQYCINCKI